MQRVVIRSVFFLLFLKRKLNMKRIVGTTLKWEPFPTIEGLFTIGNWWGKSIPPLNKHFCLFKEIFALNLNIIKIYLRFGPMYRYIPSVYIKIALLIHIYTIIDNKQDQFPHSTISYNLLIIESSSQVSGWISWYLELSGEEYPDIWSWEMRMGGISWWWGRLTQSKARRNFTLHCGPSQQPVDLKQ